MSLWFAPETYSPAEREVLARHVTNLDGPVFALVNLPEVVKGALFARYSRSAKPLRRLFLDEFAEDVPRGDAAGGVGGARAEKLYDRVFVEYTYTAYFRIATNEDDGARWARRIADHRAVLVKDDESGEMRFLSGL